MNGWFRFRRRLVTPLPFAALLSTAATAHAVDRFEIQVYDGTANAPGDASLENHVSFVDRGKRNSYPELPTDHQAHWTFEGALGVTPFWEPGVYLQNAVVPGSGYEFAGVKLRSKFVTPPGFSRFMRFGLNFELGDVPPSFEQNRWAVEARPIAALVLPRLLLAINPIVSFPISGGDGPEFEPCISAKGRLSSTASLGIEYYAGLGPFAEPLASKDQDHYLFLAGDYDLGAGFDLNFGVGAGLSDASDALTIKGILAYDFGRLW